MLDLCLTLLPAAGERFAPSCCCGRSTPALYVLFAVRNLKGAVFVAVSLMWSGPRNSSEQRSGFSQLLSAATAAVL